MFRVQSIQDIADEHGSINTTLHLYEAPEAPNFELQTLQVRCARTYRTLTNFNQASPHTVSYATATKNVTGALKALSAGLTVKLAQIRLVSPDFGCRACADHTTCARTRFRFVNPTAPATNVLSPLMTAVCD